MGLVRLRTLQDYARWGCHVRLTCDDCGRSAVFDAHGLALHFRTRNWNTSLDIAGAKFRCVGGHDGPKGCGSRRISIRPESNGKALPPDPPRTMNKPVPPCPAGIDAVRWAKGDERERKRLLAQLRG